MEQISRRNLIKAGATLSSAMVIPLEKIPPISHHQILAFASTPVPS